MKWLINMRVRNGQIVDKGGNSWTGNRVIDSNGRFGGGGNKTF